MLSTSEVDKEESLNIEESNEKKNKLDNSDNTFIVHSSRHEQNADRSRRLLSEI